MARIRNRCSTRHCAAGSTSSSSARRDSRTTRSSRRPHRFARRATSTAPSSCSTTGRDLVAACGADGVHVGRSDTPVAEARSLVGPERLVGLSVSTLDELGDVGGADYVGVTAFATPTKEDAVAGGLELLRAAAETLTVPWFAIGGIELSNVAEVAGVGAPGVAVVRAIRDADDPEAAARDPAGGARSAAVGRSRRCGGSTRGWAGSRPASSVAAARRRWARSARRQPGGSPCSRARR